jgi:hypothetical protein
MIDWGRRAAVVAMCFVTMMSIAGTQIAQAQERAPTIRSVQIGTQEIRLAAPESFCFVDPKKRAHQSAWEYVQSQTEGELFVAAVALCAGLAAGEPIGLTALFAVSSETDLPREAVLDNANGIMTTTVAPVYRDHDLFARESMRRFKETEKMEIASFRDEEVFVQMGTDGPREVLFMLGMTPLRVMILRSLTLYPITEEKGVAFSLWLHTELLGSVRRNTPGWSRDD